MSDPTETARRVLDLDKQATQGPWTPQTVEGVDSDTFSAAGPEHSLTDDEDDDERDNAMDRAQADAHLIAEYRTAAPELARALIESQAARDRALALAARGSDMAKESQAALAAATEEQSRAWALLTGERWTQTRAEGSLVEAAARMRDQLAAANARAETAERQIAVHEASAQEQLRLSLAVGAAMREVTQTEIGSGNHAAARARWEEAKKKFAAFELAPLTGPLERIEAERDALRSEVQAANARADLAYEEKALADREFVASQKIVRELVGFLATARTYVDQPMFDDEEDADLLVEIDALLAKHAAPAPTPADAKEDDRG